MVNSDVYGYTKTLN